MVEYINNTNYEVDLKSIDKVIKLCLKEEKVKNAYFSIIFVDNNEIHKINKQYRNIDKETDVISFALEDDKSYPDLNVRMLGDIYISVDRIKSQALDYGHSEIREQCFLALHGLLHLLGYDHTKSKEEEKIMFDKQDLILSKAGINR